MIFLCAFLTIISIGLVLCIIYVNDYNKLNTLRIKIDNSNNKITECLKEKHELMNKLCTQIKKVVKKKDYLKDFSALKNKNLSNYELDAELIKHLETMKKFKEDYKELNTKDINDILENIKELDQTITANKRFFNKNNNNLIKILKGHIKLVAKINKIYVKTSYETKEPVKD